MRPPQQIPAVLRLLVHEALAVPDEGGLAARDPPVEDARRLQITPALGEQMRREFIDAPLNVEHVRGNFFPYQEQGLKPTCFPQRTDTQICVATDMRRRVRNKIHRFSEISEIHLLKIWPL